MFRVLGTARKRTSTGRWWIRLQKPLEPSGSSRDDSNLIEELGYVLLDPGDGDINQNQSVEVQITKVWTKYNLPNDLPGRTPNSNYVCSATLPSATSSTEAKLEVLKVRLEAIELEMKRIHALINPPVPPFEFDETLLPKSQTSPTIPHAEGNLEDEEGPRTLRRSIIASILALSLRNMVLFAGPPGGGKSHLAAELAEWIGGDQCTLAVRPGWIDSSDLVGYWDQLHTHYVSTKFTEALRSFQRRHTDDSDSIFSLILEECNLARIENYASDLLQFLGSGPDSERPLTLQLFQESSLSDLPNEERPSSQIAYPANFLVMGTLNNDHTTQLVSPKVIDRSLVVRVDPLNRGPDAPFPTSISLRQQPETPGGIVSYLRHRRAFKPDFMSLTSDTKEKLRALTMDFPDLVPPLTLRTRTCFSMIPDLVSLLGYEESEVIDHLIQLRILPTIRVSFTARDEVHSMRLQRFSRQLHDVGMILSAGAVDRMFEDSLTEHPSSYFQ